MAAGGTWGLLLAAACVVAGCKKGSGEPAPPAEPVVNLGQENVALAEPSELRSGPGISGTLQARTAAAVRAQVGGTVLDIKAQQGQVVKKGQELARIDDATLRDQLIATRTAVSTARNALRVAEAEQERSAKLAKAGVITQRDFERAQLSVAQAKGQLAEAHSRQTLAREQLGRTRVVAPFAGVVSERQASVGDVVQPGSPLFTVVDPRTLRLEASVPAANLDQVKVQTPVEFKVTGYGDNSFTGQVERINPVVDPNTGQVRIYVAIPNTDLQLLAGLFAEGRVAAKAVRALSIPLGAVDDTEGKPGVMRVRDERVERVPITLGLRDDVEQRVEVRQGLQQGDVVLLGSARDEVTDGSRVKVDAPRPGEQPTRDEGPGVGGGGSAPSSRQGPEGTSVPARPAPSSSEASEGAPPPAP
ncbi:efflux RND transporter periplasmic adaptor subunit [Myxococcus sp. AM011]|uniref:efflux RND transporter periplasmic adaptor subunit n=1 Tax=Myxococcus sp. AM011 TaxID=2745200 RepID=UPI001594E939|nr:efflux RND transporter periplasmic adaptor subunit [Myxococcus sp. AM011]NVJ26669.1 efflux RND transporter periplasmic adaptor subunit [Myxococcus sp. AM011]